MRKTCLNMIYEMAKRDPRVVFVGSDLGPGTLDEMKHEMPERFFMEGVSEANIIGLAAGLAMDGFIPYINTIATFLTRRCYEQVAVDLCVHNLPVRLVANGGGLVYAPLGPTHIAIEDMGIMRALPNMTVVAPSDAEEMQRLMPNTLDWPGPMYIRFAKGGDPVVSDEQRGFAIGKAISMTPPGDVLLVANGVMTGRCLDAAAKLGEQGISAGVLHVHTLKPFDGAAVLRDAAQARLVVTVEEHLLAGGLGTSVAELFVDNGVTTRLKRIGIDDEFTKKYGSQDDLLQSFGLTPDGIAATVTETLNADAN
jgi:transketolase